jgi:predicted lipid-binding transport protein (Tim44 family)
MRSARSRAASAPGIGLASGAAIGVVLALLLAGSSTAASALIIGAALGLIIGAAVQAQRPTGRHR